MGLDLFDSNGLEIFGYPSGRVATKVVAASDSSAVDKAQADYVCDGTDDQVEIEAAIGSGSCRVVLCVGTFYCRRASDWSAAIRITANDVILEGQGGATVLKIPDTTNYHSGIIKISGLRVMVRNMTLDGNQANQGAYDQTGISIYYDTVTSGFSTVDNVIAHDFKSYGVYLNSADRCTVKNSRLYDMGTVGQVGLDVWACSDCTFTHNEIYGVEGMRIRGASWRLTIDHNYIHDIVAQFGIDFSEPTGGDHVVDSNIFCNIDVAGTGKYAIQYHPSPLSGRITNNQCYNVAKGMDLAPTVADWAAIGYSPKNYVVVTGNIVDKTTEHYGFEINGVTGVIANNVFRRVYGDAGLSILATQGAVIANNVCVNNGQGLSSNERGIELGGYNATNKQSKNNLVIGNSCFDDQANVSSVLTGTAAASQKVVAVTSGAKFVEDQWVTISDGTPYTENNQIASISSNNLTMTTNLANTYTVAQSAVVTGRATQWGGILEGQFDWSSNNTFINNKVYGNTSYQIATDASNPTGSGAVIRQNQGYVASGEDKTASGVLVAGNANAYFFTWHNPEAQDILIRKVVIEITTPGGTGLSVGQVGISDNATGTNLGTEFFPAAGINLNTAAVLDSWNTTDTGVQTKFVLCQDSASSTDGWIVGKILTQNAASLVGRYYVYYTGR